ncbi:unnamed protein product [Strongylus vulgaris]|uniref:Uncharacterized protein n=1 Tax=Strongylus vulgaris TaxID=40348 RepID=A0A3P7JLQ5_STRVU|nr:unnamed protein product [Strongylus vulgaris]
MVEALDGQELHVVAPYRIRAYIYEVLNVVKVAFNGATGRYLENFRGIMVREDLTTRDPCPCGNCSRPNMFAGHFNEEFQLKYPDAPLMQIDDNGVKRFLAMEQIWTPTPFQEEEISPIALLVANLPRRSTLSNYSLLNYFYSQLNSPLTTAFRELQQLGNA